MLLPKEMPTGQRINQANSEGMIGLLPFDQVDEITDGSMSFNGMTEKFIGLQRVPILSSDLFSFDESPFFQVRNNALDGSFRNTDSESHFPENHRRILRQ